MYASDDNQTAENCEDVICYESGNSGYTEKVQKQKRPGFYDEAAGRNPAGL